MQNFKNLTPTQKMALPLGFFGFMVIGIAVLTMLRVQANKEDKNGSVSSPPAEEITAVSDVVMAFGTKMKQVSVLAPTVQAQAAMDTHYKPLVSTELLVAWKAKPDDAPGRTTSSPWPEKIIVAQVSLLSEGKYKVDGNVLEMTSDSLAKNKPVAVYPVVFEVEKQHDAWLITSFEKGAYSKLPEDIMVQGMYVCLPHTDKTGPQTEECALGLAIDQSDGFYALDMSRTSFPADFMMSLKTGDKITVEGTLTPINQISSNHWQKYDVDGILSVTNITKGFIKE
jgi:hypothetical protein